MTSAEITLVAASESSLANFRIDDIMQRVLSRVPRRTDARRTERLRGTLLKTLLC